MTGLGGKRTATRVAGSEVTAVYCSIDPLLKSSLPNHESGKCTSRSHAVHFLRSLRIHFAAIEHERKAIIHSREIIRPPPKGAEMAELERVDCSEN